MHRSARSHARIIHGLVLTAVVALAAVLLSPAITKSGLTLGGDSADASGPAVLVESNFNGSLTSHPADHHRVTTDPETGQSSDWASDWSVSAGTPITPQLNGPYGTTLKVMDVQPSCSGGADGGTAVRIAVYEPNGGPRIGWVAYLHLADVAVSAGQVVATDTVIGTVGSFTPNEACWTGPHVHIEGFNDHEYSCYYAPASVAPGNPIGRIGGSDVGSAPAPCP